ncbi:hypothetical protein [Microtetraspora fusca]|uniref:hypothetical protein n=1 Tax=Microtetraspora fusca TaxID=1997 RepID=UPI0012FC500C|nr:hypothetical protein [Microtetraspora fusca]
MYDSATGLTISPSCCSGLEDWREWGALPQGYWPFLGHDPSPWIEILSDRFRVWPDDGRSAGDLFIDIPARELPGLLRGVQRDLLGFLNAVEKWALAIFPDRTPALLELLDECFDIRSALDDSAG